MITQQNIIWTFFSLTHQAKVVCKQLGYPYAEMATKNSYFGAASPPFSYHYVSCNGYESKLDYCYDDTTPLCYGKYRAAGIHLLKVFVYN